MSSGKTSKNSHCGASSSTRSPFFKLFYILVLFGALAICTHAEPTSPNSANINLDKRQPQTVAASERGSNLVDMVRRMPAPKKGGKKHGRKPGKRAGKGGIATKPEVLGGVVVMPAVLKLSANFKFIIKLAEAPKSDVTVYIEAETIMFDRCQIVFTPANWDKPQRLKITQVPFFDPKESRLEFPGRIKLSSKDTKFHTKEAKFTVKRNNIIGGTCISANDPHMTSFDGKKIEMHAAGGPFYLVKSHFLTVQFQTAKCGATVTCNTAVAVRYGNALYIRRGAQLSVASPPAHNANVRCLGVRGGAHTLKLSDGTVITIGGAHGRLIGSVHISLAGHARGHVQGICGNFNGNPADDNRGPNGQAHGGSQLGNSWRVPARDNLFKLGIKATSFNKPVVYQRTAVCKIPAILQGTGEGPDAPPGTTIINKITVTKFNVKQEPPVINIKVVKEDPKVKQLAEKMCKTVFINEEANKIVDPKNFIENCLIDAKSTDSLAFIEVMKTTYLTLVSTRIAVPKAIEEPKQRKIAIEVTVNDGLDKQKCPNDCNKNGECTPNGCLCRMGFTGTSCEEKIPLELTIMPTGEKKPPPVEGPVVKISVTKIDVKDTDVGQKFTIVLPAEPTDKVDVFMELPGFLFNKPSISFDKTNWDKPQTVIINQVPYFNTKKGPRKLKLLIRTSAFQDLRFHDKKIEIPVTRQGGIGSTTIVLNHPHITTFDKLQIDVMESGIFTLIESPPLTVQIIIQQINEKVAVTRSLAFRYGKTVFIFDGKLGIRKASAGSDGVEVVATKSHTEVRFQLSDGTVIKTQRTDETISVEIEVAPRYRTKTTGISGNFDGDKENDTTSPDGKVIKPGPKKVLWPDGSEFAKTWVVKPTNNLFACGATCADYQKAEPEINTFETTIPLTLDGNGLVAKRPTGYIVISSVERYIVQIPPPEKLKVVIKVPELKPEFEDESKKICTTMFKNEEANKLVDPKPFVDACLADSRATGTFTFTDEIKINYFNTVRMSTRSMIIDPNADTKIALNIEIKLGLGNANCPQDCSGRGECRASGCKCIDGYTGLGCEVKITTVVKIIQLPPQTIEFKIVTGAVQIEHTTQAGDGAEKPPTTLVEQLALEGKTLPKPGDDALVTVTTTTKEEVFPTTGDEEANKTEGGEGKPEAGGDKAEAKDGKPEAGGDKAGAGGDKPEGGGDKGEAKDGKPEDKVGATGDKPGAEAGGDKPDAGGDKPAAGADD